jgi:seryl-tRNA synthetase
LHEGLATTWELVKYSIIDFRLGVENYWCSFQYIKEKSTGYNALINYFLDRNTAAGYSEVQEVPLT